MRYHQVLGPALGGADPDPGFLAIEGAAHDHIDHAGHRIGTVEGGGPIEQDIDTFDRSGWQGRYVGELPPVTRAREPAAIDQDQGGVGPETAQVHAGGEHRVGPGSIDPGQRRCGIGRAGVVLGQVLQDLGHRGGSTAIQIVSTQDDDRRGEFAGRLQQGARNDDLVQQDGAFRRLGRPASAQENDPRARLGPGQA